MEAFFLNFFQKFIRQPKRLQHRNQHVLIDLCCSLDIVRLGTRLPGFHNIRSTPNHWPPHCGITHGLRSLFPSHMLLFPKIPPISIGKTNTSGNVLSRLSASETERLGSPTASFFTERADPLTIRRSTSQSATCDNMHVTRDTRLNHERIFIQELTLKSKIETIARNPHTLRKCEASLVRLSHTHEREALW